MLAYAVRLAADDNGPRITGNGAMVIVVIAIILIIAGSSGSGRGR